MSKRRCRQTKLGDKNMSVIELMRLPHFTAFCHIENAKPLEHYAKRPSQNGRLPACQSI
jgi:hypothetical protein